MLKNSHFAETDKNRKAALNKFIFDNLPLSSEQKIEFLRLTAKNQIEEEEEEKKD
jgi:hypothetical protein